MKFTMNPDILGSPITLPIDPLAQWLVGKDLEQVALQANYDSRRLRDIRAKRRWNATKKTWVEWKEVGVELVEKIILPNGAYLSELYPYEEG